MSHPNAAGIALILAAALLGAALALGLQEWDAAARTAYASLRLPSALASGPELDPAAVEADAAWTAPGDAASGARLFAARCNVCHPNGKAGLGSVLFGPQFAEKYVEDPALKEAIRARRRGMPGYPLTRLSAENVADLVAFVRSLK